MQNRDQNKSWKRASVLLMALLLLPLLAQAQDKKISPVDLQPLEEIPPPTISADDNPDEPQVTIIKKQGETIEEYRINGQLYMMKITPAHGVPYYLHKEDQDGSWVNTGPTPPMSIPKWTIFRF
ncbi:MAG: DUF2782 domain-containing protein [Methylotenera sp.]|nr:DUF2782 domain-containing protein [Methylotenera sp.]